MNIVDPDYDWVVARYIENNPVIAGIVTVADNYEYSSARAHLRMTKDVLLTKDILQDRNDEYQEFFNNDELDKSGYLKQVHTIIEQEKVWGNIKFVEKIEQRFKAVFRVRQRGRPVRIKNK